MRRDVQFLRAIAVTAVVVFHLWPKGLTGGYIGVDIFFVISGFLITSHLLKELKSSGSLSFSRFYARRARRILPAALTVLALIIVGTLIWTPLADWATSFRQILASTLFYENWQLGADQVNYLTAEAAPSPVQHYWSLSVEEQFYLFWPLLLWLTYVFFKPKKSWMSGTVLAVFILVGAASLVYSIWYTQADPIPAFFSTGTRVWEFVMGGLIAVIPTLGRAPRAFRIVLAAAGWLAVGASIFLFTSKTPFPGWTALIPVVGTAIIIWADADKPSASRLRLTVEKPVLFIAELSFAIYLFHWPLIIFGEQALGHALGWKAKVAILIGSVLLAWLVTQFIERPIRFGAFAKNVRARTQLLVALACIVALALTSLTATSIIGRMESSASASTTDMGPCFGALSRLPGNKCEGVTFSKLTPSPQMAFSDKSGIATGTKCGADQDQTQVFSCQFGNAKSAFRIALIGDSHAEAIFPAIKALAEKNKWSLTTYGRSACPFLGHDYIGNLTDREKKCNTWNHNLAAKLAAQPAFNIVYVTSNHHNGLWGTDTQAADSFSAAWTPLINRGTQVVAIRDVPNMRGALECLQRNSESPEKCDISESKALGPDPLIKAVKQTPGSFLVDLTSYFCWTGSCHIAIGGSTAYRDDHHLTSTFARTLSTPIYLAGAQAGVNTK